MKFNSRILVILTCIVLFFTFFTPINVHATTQSAPTNLTAKGKYVPASVTSTGTTIPAKKGIELRWTAPSLAEKYDIYRASILTGRYELLTTVKAPATSYFDTSINGGVTYYYYVQAYHTHFLSLTPDRSPYTPTVSASYVPVSRISTNSTTYAPMIGGLSAKINVTVSPSNATYSTLKFVSSNPNVCIVSSNGTLTGKTPGVATITIQSVESPTVKISVQCVAKIEPILAPTVFRTNKINVPVWSQPSSTSIKRGTIAYTNTGVVIVDRTVNSAGNIWLKTHAGGWIFDGNLTKYKYQINTGEVGEFEKPTNTTNVFREQLVRGSTCTLASYANLMRRYEIIYKNTVTLLNKDENYFKQFAWTEGLIWYTTVDIFTPQVVVKREALSGDVSSKKSKLISYLKTRPEGILVFSKNDSGEGKHMVLLTDYDSKTDTFYMYDPICCYKDLTGRLELTKAKIYGTTQNDKISHIFAVWIITSPTIIQQ
jgi:hypothetical protein